jgi:hypothetical protein
MSVDGCHRARSTRDDLKRGWAEAYFFWGTSVITQPSLAPLHPSEPRGELGQRLGHYHLSFEGSTENRIALKVRGRK